MAEILLEQRYIIHFGIIYMYEMPQDTTTINALYYQQILKQLKRRVIFPKNRHKRKKENESYTMIMSDLKKQ